jgi:hypothetical protein
VQEGAAYFRFRRFASMYNAFTGWRTSMLMSTAYNPCSSRSISVVIGSTEYDS